MKKGSIINITIDTYKKLIDHDYEKSRSIDEELGIEYLPETKLLYSFAFKVVDINRFLLAKIKYNI